MIIAALGSLLVLLSGCSALRLGYGQAEPFAFRWLDRYADFDDAQSVRARDGLRSWFAWHRRTQLDGYADLLLRVDSTIRADTTPEHVCGWWDEARGHIDVALVQAAPVIVEVGVMLKPAQLEHIQRQYAKSNREYRDDFLQADPARRAREATKRVVGRAESLYGKLDDAQRARVAQWQRESPFDAEVSFEERQRRQQDVLQLLRRLQGVADADAGVADVRVWVRGIDRSPREGYRRYAERLVKANCRLAADIHNTTNPAQREAASRQLRTWAADLRALAADGRG